MRIPHYLTRAPSGRYIFRLRVPDSLRMVFGRKVIKHTLRTADTLTAHRYALELASRYAHAFECIRGHGMTNKITVGEVLGNVAENGAQDYVITTSNGTRIEARTAADHARAMEAVAAIGKVGILTSQPAPAPAPAPAVPVVAQAIELGKGRDAWIKKLEANTLPKTLTIKKTAINSLVDYLGAKRALHTIERPDLARFYQHLSDAGAATPTLVNKQSYLGGKHGFFAWAAASGHYPKFSKGDNPAADHIHYSTNEKRKRKKFGFKPFDIKQLQALFAPDAFAKLSPHARWAAVLGLYTGSRASEVGQLLTTDIVDMDGTPAIRITDEGEDQKVKTEASLRTVPIHADLITLGFLDYIKSLSADDWRVFPNGNPKAKNGQGNWISKAFSAHVSRNGASWPKAKRGFHSLRKSFIQEAQGFGMASEMRVQIVGHEFDDEHHATYSRDFTAAEKLNGMRAKGFKTPGMKALNYGLDLEGLRPLLTASVNSKPAKVPGRRESSPAKARKRVSTSGKR